MLKKYPVLKLISLLALGVLTAACDSGSVGNTSNPNLGANSGNRFVYSGPPPRAISMSVISNTICGAM